MYKTKVEEHFDKVAENYDLYKEKNSFYYDNLKKLLKILIPEHGNVFEFGCGTGDLIASLNPTSGVGYDTSVEMVKKAKFKYKSKKNLKFLTTCQSGTYDYIFMSDVIEHLEDPEEEFKNISKKLMNKSTFFIITMANPVWEPILMIVEKLGLKMPEGPHERIKYKDIKILSKNNGMKIIKHDYKLLIPIKITFITEFANKYLEKYFKKFSFIEYFVIKK